MKKLMIAAAAAVMISGVEAYDFDYVYDFNASLTTTTGTEGKNTKKTYTVNLGKDATGKWWYNDSIFVYNTSDPTKYKDAVIGSYVISKALKAGNKMYPWKLNTSVVKTDDEKIILAGALGFDGKDTNYPVKQEYRGRMVWCETFKFKYTYLGDCYRVKGSKKIKGLLVVADNCDDAELYEDMGDDQYDGPYKFETKFFNFFGAQDPAKATKVEALYTFDQDDMGNGALDMADGTNFGFALAGQGTWKDKLFTIKNVGDYPGVNSMSGNIVGYLAAPDCEACCANPVSALAFECDIADPEARIYSWDLPTAAYGSWSMKFNKKKTFDYNGIQ